MKRIDENKCEYLEDDDLPKLVLALHHEYDIRYDLKDNKNDLKDNKNHGEWRYIVHQTAGHGCHQHYMFAKILTPDKKVSANMKELSEMWFESDAGMFGVSLDELLQYRKDIKKMFGVDCNNSYMDLEEGIYPIDCTKKNLSKMCKDDLPDDIDGLIRWKKKTDLIIHLVGRWNLYILGENCD